MKRGFVLLALVVLVVGLAIAMPADVKKASSNAASAPATVKPAVPEEQCCLNENETDPHMECFNHTCVEVNGCGPNVDCTTCGCDPYEEWACISNGGDWDPYLCSCTYGCDPDGSGEADCWSIGGTWDPFTCICYPPQCNPGPPQIAYTQQWSDYYCDGYHWVDCENTCIHYVQYCQDGSIYNQWTECTSVCVPSGDSCGPGGGGDPGDCDIYYRPGGKDNETPTTNGLSDCWCVFDWGICCDSDSYCWEI
jgi:hypothetical protein